MLAKSYLVGVIVGLFLITVNHFLSLSLEFLGIHWHHFMWALILLFSSLTLRWKRPSLFLAGIGTVLLADDWKDLISADPIYWLISSALVLLAVAFGMLIWRTVPDEWVYEA